jgi:hypothetical protein
MTFRVGIFFLFFGLVSLAVYFASDFAGAPSFLLFFASLGLIFLGIALMRKGYAPPPPSERFRFLRRMRDREKKDSAR